MVFVPLRGVSCFYASASTVDNKAWAIPSPCGVWVVSIEVCKRLFPGVFPSPCGV